MASNSVFISYRRNVSGYAARAVFQNLTAHNIDTFMDIESIDSGQFETIIFNQIAARPYFLVILGPGCLERCADPNDWLRVEIEHAISLDRDIIPLLTSDFSFKEAYAQQHLTGRLEKLSRYNAVNVHLDYFEEAMQRLRTRFIKSDLHITETPSAERAAVQEKIEQAKAEPIVTEKELSAQEYFERYLVRKDKGDLDGANSDYAEAVQLNPQYACTITEPVILLTINKSYRDSMSDDELYKVTRGDWPVSETRCQKAKYAMALVHGTIKAVYLIKPGS